jgi:AraC-like DNA-binding protein
MKVDRAFPPPALGEYVRCFEQRRARLDDAGVVFPIAARIEQFLEFYLEERCLACDRESGAVDLAPRSVVVGPIVDRRLDLMLRGNLDVFTVQFRPTGFHRLFGVPMIELADRGCDARSIVGPAISELENELAGSSSFDRRLRACGAFLVRRVWDRVSLDPVVAIAERIALKPMAFRTDKAAARTGLSVRQFERRFAALVGAPPKSYAGIVRFNAALDAKMREPRRLWTHIAQDLGYFDQTHMNRDFERFAGESPSAIMRRLGGVAGAWA